MAEADAPATCPDGHVDTTRLLSVFASTSGGGTSMPSAPSCGRRVLRRSLRLRLTRWRSAPSTAPGRSQQLGDTTLRRPRRSAAASPAPAWRSTPPPAGCAPRSSSGTTSPAARRRSPRSSCTAACATCRTATSASSTRPSASASGCATTPRTSCGCSRSSSRSSPRTGSSTRRSPGRSAARCGCTTSPAAPASASSTSGSRRTRPSAHMPTLPEERLAGAYLYYDAAADDARLTLTLARTAALDHGAVVANHAGGRRAAPRRRGRAAGAVVEADGRAHRGAAPGPS